MRGANNDNGPGEIPRDFFVPLTHLPLPISVQDQIFRHDPPKQVDDDQFVGHFFGDALKPYPVRKSDDDRAFLASAAAKSSGDTDAVVEADLRDPLPDGLR